MDVHHYINGLRCIAEGAVVISSVNQVAMGDGDVIFSPWYVDDWAVEEF